jgi:hydrogenase maturation protease
MRGPTLLVIGCGNPARGDDGLGIALAGELERLGLPGVAVEMDYQLAIEHAALVAAHDIVVFADAALDADRAFYFRRLDGAAATPACFSHALAPQDVVALARSCFAAAPRAYVLGIRARRVDQFVEGLTSGARSALGSALAHLLRFIERERGRPPARPARRRLRRHGEADAGR